MSNITTTPQELSLYLVNTGAGTGGGWLPGEGPPLLNQGHVGQRYVDTLTGNIYGPKTRNGWPPLPTNTLNLGNISGNFANALSRIPAIEGMVAGQGSTLKNLSTQVNGFAGSIGAIQNSFTSINIAIQQLTGRTVSLEDATAALVLSVNDRLNEMGKDITNQTSMINGIDYALRQDILAVQSGMGDISAQLSQDRLAWATEAGALASSITQLNTKYNGLNESIANVTQEMVSISNDAQAYSGVVTALYAEFNDNKAAVNSQLTAAVTASESAATSVTALTSEFNNHKASINQRLSTFTNAQTAQATDIYNLNAAVQNAQAAISNEQTARVSSLNAVSNSVSNLSATVGGHSATINSQSTAIANLNGYINSSYTINSTVTSNTGKKVITGLTIRSGTGPNGTTQSDIIFQANNFQIVSGNNGAAKSPFRVKNGITYIDNAVIENLSLGGNLIANGGQITFTEFNRGNGATNVSINVPAGETWQVFSVAAFDGGSEVIRTNTTDYGGDVSFALTGAVTVTIPRTLVKSELVRGGETQGNYRHTYIELPITRASIVTLGGPGNYTITANNSSASPVNLVCFIRKK